MARNPKHETESDQGRSAALSPDAAVAAFIGGLVLPGESPAAR